MRIVSPRPLRHFPCFSHLIIACTIFISTGSAVAATDWSDYLNRDDAWHQSREGKAVLEHVLARQHTNGGWNKNYDPGEAVSPEDIEKERPKPATIDNNATTSEMKLLAHHFAATGHAEAKEAFVRGLDFLLAAQYDNGGWPQFYPLRGRYRDAITYNDDAMVNVLRLLKEIAQGKQPFGFLTDEQRQRAAEGFRKGIQCVLDTQVVVDGKRTAWCAQHDARSLKPTIGRAYEHPSLSGSESVALVRLLMSIDHPSEPVIASVQSAVAWLDQSKITGVRYERVTNPDGSPDRRLVETGNPDDVWWARFYDIETNRPIFSGRDSVIRFDLREVEEERRMGYAWYSSRAARLLSSEYPQWQQRWVPNASVLDKH